MWGAPWAPSIITTAPRAWARAVIFFMGLIVPRALETWAIETILVRGESSFS
jgi:hypothetical protein